MTYLSAYLSIYLFVYPTVYLHTYQPLKLPAYPSIFTQPYKYHHHHHYQSQYLHLPTFALMNGSVSVIGEGHNGFINCIANLRLPCRVNWTVSPRRHTPPDLHASRPTKHGRGRGWRRDVRRLSDSLCLYRLQWFSTHLSGRYTCTHLPGHAHRTTPTVHFLAPSNRAVLFCAKDRRRQSATQLAVSRSVTHCHSTSQPVTQ